MLLQKLRCILLPRKFVLDIQVIPGNDQNTSPTNQKTVGSNLERTSQLMFYGSSRHLKSFSGNFLVLIFLLGCLLTYLVKSLVFNATIFE